MLGIEVQSAEKPHEISKTEFGAEYSDGSSTISGDSALFTPKDGFILLKVDSGRPVDRAASTLQARYGYAITYEDPPYTNGDDLQDVSAKVVRNYWAYPHWVAPKVIVPRGGALTLHLPTSSHIDSQGLDAILQQLVRAQANSPRGGRFRIEQAGDVFHVIPTEVRDQHGNWSAIAPLLDVLISLPTQSRSYEELIEAVCKAVSAATRIEMLPGAGTGGFGIFGSTVGPKRYVLGSNHEPARRVLDRILSAVEGDRGRLSWVLLYSPEPTRGSYYLNILPIPAEVQGTESTNPRLTPIPGRPHERSSGTGIQH